MGTQMGGGGVFNSQTRLFRPWAPKSLGYLKLALMIEAVPQPPTRQGPASLSGFICLLSASSNKADHSGLLHCQFSR